MVREIILANDTVQRKRLFIALEKKKKLLLKVTNSYETLKNELDVIKREYYLRVGSLLKRDNDLDLEIIKYKNILACMIRGMSYDEAVESLKNRFYTDDEYTNDYTYGADESASIHTETNETKEKLRLLWKKIVTRFHPDLTVDAEEKKRREEIMKQVNKAYAEGNHAALEEIYRSNHVVPLAELTSQDLQKMLIQVENSIITMQKEIAGLKKTEWYGWKKKLKKAKSSGEDIFRELEHALLDDIVKKNLLMRDLIRQVKQFRAK